MRGQFTSALLRYKRLVPWADLDPGSNIQISVNSFCFFYRFIARSDDALNSILYQGGDVACYGFFNKQAKNTMATKQDSEIKCSASGTLQPASSSTIRILPYASIRIHTHPPVHFLEEFNLHNLDAQFRFRFT